jgi:signal transduction histidine kinase
MSVAWELAPLVVSVGGFWVFLYNVANLIASLITAAISGYSARTPDSPASKPLAVLTAGGSLWGASVVIQNVSDVYIWSRIGVQLAYIGITVGVTGWIAFSLAMTNREEWLTRRTIALLVIEPIVINVLGATTELLGHGLFWTSIGPSSSAINGVTSEWGVFFFVHTVYMYLGILFGTLLLVHYAIGARDVYRWQAVAILTAVAGPWTGSILFLSGIVPLDLGPVGYVVAGTCLFWAIYRYRLMDLTPIARDVLVERISNAVVVLDEHDRVIDINSAGRALLNVGPDENAVGTPAEKIFSQVPALLEHCDVTESVTEEVELVMNTQPRQFELEVSPLEGEGGRLVGRLFLLQEITEQKRQQQELEHQNDQLERFASVVSHDLRNPLNVAEGYVQIAQEKYDDEIIDEIAYSHSRMEQIIEDVLTMAREGQEVEELEPVHLADLSETAWEHVDTHEALLEVDADRTIQADSNRLLNLFENLFRNALDHGPADATVRVETIGFDDDDSAEGFAVADDGPGIPEDQRDQVLEAGHTTAEDGTGLGLSIVQSVAEAHGWEIAVAESESGGARFEITGVTSVGEQAKAVAP